MEGQVGIGPGWVAARENFNVGVTVFNCQTGSFNGERSGGPSAPEDVKLVFVQA